VIELVIAVVINQINAIFSIANFVGKGKGEKKNIPPFLTEVFRGEARNGEGCAGL